MHCLNKEIPFEFYLGLFHMAFTLDALASRFKSFVFSCQKWPTERISTPEQVYSTHGQFDKECHFFFKHMNTPETLNNYW